MTDYLILRNAVTSRLMHDGIATDDWTVITLLAEAKIAREIRTVAQEKSTDLSVDGRSVTLPTDFLEVRALYRDNTYSREIDYLTPEALRRSPEWVNSVSNIGNNPVYYSLEGDNSSDTDDEIIMVFAPAGNPTTPTTVPLLYYSRFAALSDDADTNWLLRNHFDIYFYSMLEAAADHLEEEELATKYAGKFLGAKESLSRHENRKRFRGNNKHISNFPRTVV